MAYSIVPLDQISNQTFSITLGSQSCQIKIDSKGEWGVFASVWVDDTPIVQSALCINRVGIVRYAYTGFVGELYFVDTQGSDDPDYTGFSDRFLLVYDDSAVLS